MLNWNYPVVSGLYFSKKGNVAAYKYVGEPKLFEPLNFEDLFNKISFVDGIGLGCALINMKVFDILEKKGLIPWFEYRIEWEKSNVKREVSEDLDFCLKLKEAGFGIMLLGQIVCKHELNSFLLPDGKIEYSILS